MDQDNAPYTRAPEDVIALVHAIASEHHARLGGSNIAVLFKAKATKRRGKIVLATASLPAPKMRPLLAEDVDFVIVIAADEWGTAPQPQREATVDHELCHCTLDPESGEPKLRDHDYEEFAEIQERHGFWRGDHCERAIQLALGLPRAEVKVSTLM